MKFFSPRNKQPRLFDIPRGAFTYDAEGRILASSVPTAWLEEFGPLLVKGLRKAFASAEESGMPMTEIALYFGGARLTVKELRGGGLVYILPGNKSN